MLLNLPLEVKTQFLDA